MKNEGEQESGKKEKKTEKKRNETVVGNMICNGINL